MLNFEHIGRPSEDYRFVREYNAKGDIVKTTTVWTKSFLRNRGKYYCPRSNRIEIDPRFIKE
jgi:hypothetical protein